MVEVLKEGEQIHPFDEHFQFGVEKARLLLFALPIIKEFVANDGFIADTDRIVCDETTGVIRVWIKSYQEFIHSSGATINRPWLQIIAFGCNAEIGLGLEKAKAICVLAPQLRNWLADVASLE